MSGSSAASTRPGGASGTGPTGGSSVLGSAGGATGGATGAGSGAGTGGGTGARGTTN
jgi:hypothetical protein